MKYIFLIVLFSVVGCTSSLDIPDFDEKTWVLDKNGCNEHRINMVEPLTASLEMIKGLSESEVLGLLGNPDMNELYTRNQKFYIYHITPSLECGVTGQTSQLFLEIRFSATNRAREVMVKESGE